MSKSNKRNKKEVTVDANLIVAEQTQDDTAAEIAAIEAALADESIVTDEKVLSADESILSEVVGEIQMDEAKQEAYSGQESTADVVSTDPVEAKAAPKKAPTLRATTHKKSEVAEAKGGAIMLSADTALDYKAIDGLPKKVGEKAINLVATVSGKAKLSNYTEIAVRELATKGEITTKSLFEVMRTKYTEGTSRSQTHQMFKLLPEMKIGIMDGKVMKANPESLMLVYLKTILGVTATA